MQPSLVVTSMEFTPRILKAVQNLPFGSLSFTKGQHLLPQRESLKQKDHFGSFRTKILLQLHLSRSPRDDE